MKQHNQQQVVNHSNWRFSQAHLCRVPAVLQASGLIVSEEFQKSLSALLHGEYAPCLFLREVESGSQTWESHRTTCVFHFSNRQKKETIKVRSLLTHDRSKTIKEKWQYKHNLSKWTVIRQTCCSTSETLPEGYEAMRRMEKKLCWTCDVKERCPVKSRGKVYGRITN